MTGAPIDEATLYRDPKAARRYKSLAQWESTASGKRSVAEGVIDLDVIADPATWKNPVEDLAAALAGALENRREVTIIDSQNALKTAHISMDRLAHHARESLRWDYEHAAEAEYEKGDIDRGHAMNAVANAVRGMKIEAIAKPAGRTDDTVIWLMRSEPSVPSIFKKAGL